MSNTPTLDRLYSADRILITANLQVAEGFGDRLQPASFPNLGPCLYKLPDGSDRLVLDTAQAVANWLEYICWPEGTNSYIQEFANVPSVVVLDGDRDNAFLTSSVLESHRLNSRYIYEAKLQDYLEDNHPEFLRLLADYFGFEDSRPFHRGKLLNRLFRLDPGCIIHGVFLAGGKGFKGVGGRVSSPRVLSAHVTASDPRPVNLAGTYNDRVSALHNVPHASQQYAPKQIEAQFSVHVGDLKSYAAESADDYHLTPNQIKFLIGFALRKVQLLLDKRELRPRSWCVLTVPKNGNESGESAITVKLIGPEKPASWPELVSVKEEFQQLADELFPKPKDSEAVEDEPKTQKKNSSAPALKDVLENRSGIKLIFREKITAVEPLSSAEQANVAQEILSDIVGVFVGAAKMRTRGNKTEDVKHAIIVRGYRTREEFDVLQKQIADAFTTNAPEEGADPQAKDRHDQVKAKMDAGSKKYKALLEKIWKKQAKEE